MAIPEDSTRQLLRDRSTYLEDSDPITTQSKCIFLFAKFYTNIYSYTTNIYLLLLMAFIIYYNLRLKHLILLKIGALN